MFRFPLLWEKLWMLVDEFYYLTTNFSKLKWPTQRTFWSKQLSIELHQKIPHMAFHEFYPIFSLAGCCTCSGYHMELKIYNFWGHKESSLNNYRFQYSAPFWSKDVHIQVKSPNGEAPSSRQLKWNHYFGTFWAFGSCFKCFFLKVPQPLYL